MLNAPWSIPALLLACALGRSAAAAPPPPLAVVEDDQKIAVTRGDIPVLVYHKADVPPPPGIDPVFTRSGFIHPLCAPSGGIVTGIHPTDHYHHLGLWHAWVHTTYAGQKIDFWNLKERQGTVRYARTLALEPGPDPAGFTVEQEHVAFDGRDPRRARVVLREAFTVRARFDGGAHVIDYVMAQRNVTDSALILPPYRYGGGVALRAPHDWDNHNSDYITSEGRTRADSHGTRARWCAMHGPTPKGDATVLVLGAPGNRDAPQRIRTWNNGKIFLNFVPAQETGWQIGPGEEITLRYRIVVADGRLDAGGLGKHWEQYAGER